jgi:hypothetical protein
MRPIDKSIKLLVCVWYGAIEGENMLGKMMCKQGTFTV